MHCRFVGVAADGAKLFGDMKASGDPGYKITIAMLCEAGLALSLDLDQLPGGSERGGVLTPATGLGKPYLRRLHDAGIRTTLRT